MRTEPPKPRRTIDEMLRLVERFPVIGTEYPIIRTDGLWLDNETYLQEQISKLASQPPDRGY